MNLRAYWQFYKSILPFVLGFTLVSAIVNAGFLWTFIIHCTLSLGFGFFGFAFFRKREYIFYYNLGLTKWRLLKVSFVFNILTGVLLFLCFLVLIMIVFGSIIPS